MKLDEKIADLLEEQDFTFTFDEENGNLELERYTPAGEDWIVNLWFDGTVDGFIAETQDYYQGFDVDEEVELWVDGRGQRGVPSSIRTLVEDAEWKESQLEVLYRAALNLKEAHNAA